MDDLLTVAVNVLVDRPLDACWAQLRDLSVAHHYVPGLTGTDIISAKERGEGAHRRVYSRRGYLEETVTAWREGSGFTIRLHRGEKPMAPFRHAEFDYALAAAGDVQTRVTLTMRIAMPGGALGRVAARALLPVMRRQLRQVAAGLKHYYETGRAATDADRRRLDGAVHNGPGGA
jgi:carbon monoxide dehydrogenase subunit G